MQILYDIAPNGARRARTEGLQSVGQMEISLEVNGQIPEDSSERLFRYISDYVMVSGQKIHSGETMRYGWTTLRFTLAPDGTMLQIEELAQPFSPDSSDYTAGAVNAMAILTKQDTTVRRFNIQKIGHHPHRSEMAIICRNLNAKSKIMVFDRIASNKTEDSGWFVGCGDSGHDHNNLQELARIHLAHLVAGRPKIVYYLAMPEETRVVFDYTKTIVFPPGENEGREEDSDA